MLTSASVFVTFLYCPLFIAAVAYALYTADAGEAISKQWLLSRRVARLRTRAGSCRQLQQAASAADAAASASRRLGHSRVLWSNDTSSPTGVDRVASRPGVRSFTSLRHPLFLYVINRPTSAASVTVESNPQSGTSYTLSAVVVTFVHVLHARILSFVTIEVRSFIFFLISRSVKYNWVFVASPLCKNWSKLCLGEILRVAKKRQLRTDAYYANAYLKFSVKSVLFSEQLSFKMSIRGCAYCW